MNFIEPLRLAQFKNEFVAHLMDKWSGSEACLNKGFQISLTAHKLPWWFEQSLSMSQLEGYWISHFFTKGERPILDLWLEHHFFVRGEQWFENLWLKWSNQMASVFILSGNINDYACHLKKGYMPTLDFIEEEWSNRNAQSQVIRYSLSQPFPNLEKIKYLDLRTQVETHLENRNPSDPYNQLMSDFQFLDGLVKTQRNMVIVISNAELIFANENANIYQNVLADYLLSWSLSPQVAHLHNAILLLTEVAESMNRHLVSQTSKVAVIPIPRPKTSEDRLKFLLYIHSISGQDRLYINTRSKKVSIPRTSQGGLRGQQPLTNALLTLSKQTSGLNFMGMEDLLLQIKASGSSSEQVINQVKADILQTESGGALELVSKPKDFDKDIIGYAEIKQRLLHISELIRNPNASKLQQRMLPMGILLVGPPGTGKTVIAQAFATRCGMNFLKLGDYRSKWVGESERTLTKVLDLIKSYSPVIVFMDELDQTEGARGTNGNEVDKRLFSKLLQFMGDTENRGKVLWMAASNRPDLIDAALKRPGRFDLKLPFLPQSAPDRKALFLRLLQHEDMSELTLSISTTDWHWIEERTTGFTGAEIEAIVNDAIRQKAMQNMGAQMRLTGQDLLKVIEHFKPGIDSEAFNEMLSVSLLDVTSQDLIPEPWKNWKNPFKNKLF